MRRTCRYKQTRSVGRKLLGLAALGLTSLVCAIAVPGLMHMSGLEYEAVAGSTAAPKPGRNSSGSWRADVRTWAAMIHYLFEPEPEVSRDDDWSQL